MMWKSKKLRSVLQSLLSFISFLSALPILAMLLGGAAWNGVNFVVILYMVLAATGSLGLLAGTVTAFSNKSVFAWITGISALATFCLSLLFLLSFLFTRDPAVPLNDPMGIGPIQLPTIALYGFALIFCSMVIFLCVRVIRDRSEILD